MKCPHCNGHIEPPHSANQNKCPACGQWTLIDLPSKSLRACGSCHAEFDWKLKPKQKSVLIKGLAGDG